MGINVENLSPEWALIERIRETKHLGLPTLGILIARMQIRELHDELSIAWVTQCKRVGFADPFGIPDILLKKKEALKR